MFGMEHQICIERTESNATLCREHDTTLPIKESIPNREWVGKGSPTVGSEQLHR